MVAAQGVQCEMERMEEQYPLTCLPYPFPKVLQGPGSLPTAQTRPQNPSPGTAQGRVHSWPMGKMFQFIKKK